VTREEIVVHVALAVGPFLVPVTMVALAA